MFWWHIDPGPCPVCGAPHTTCTAPSDSLVVPLLGDPPRVVPAPPPALRADQIQATLPPGEFTSATYRGKGKPRR